MYSIALLVLLAHALFVSVTHHHNVARAVTLSTASISADYGADSGGSPHTGRDGHCLSCSLQRNFISDTHTAPLIIQPLQKPAESEAFLSEPHSHGPALRTCGRAPPLA